MYKWLIKFSWNHISGAFAANHLTSQCHQNDQPFFVVCLDTGAWAQSVATCGGETVCVIDCESGHVLKKYKVPGEVCKQLFLQFHFLPADVSENCHGFSLYEYCTTEQSNNVTKRKIKSGSSCPFIHCTSLLLN